MTETDISSSASSVLSCKCQSGNSFARAVCHCFS